MSSPLKHEAAQVGNFELHDNGSIFWGPQEPRAHHMSWIDDDKKRVYAPLLPVICSPEEIAQCEELAAQFDTKGAT